MSTNFNYTGRIDIDPLDFDGTIDLVGDTYEAKVNWRLKDYEFPENADIQLHIGSVYEKIIAPLGKVGSGEGSQTIDLSRLRKPLEANMTLKVVTVDDKNIPLNRGWLNNFRPVILGNDGAGKSLLETQSVLDLDVIWRVETESGRPVLQITNRFDLYTSVLNDVIFDAVVIPAVIEEIFQWLVWQEETGDIDPEIAELWKDFFYGLGLSENVFEEFKEVGFNADSAAKSRELGRIMASKFSEGKKLLTTAATKYEESN
jgi:hypothetical protein